MEALRQLVAQAAGMWRTLQPQQRLTMAASFLAAVVAVGWLVHWSRKPDFVQLYSNLAPEEAAAIVERLRAEHVPYRMTHGGTTVEVPDSRLYDMRMEMASQGVVKPAHLGYELLDRNNIGMTDFLQRTNLLRAQEGELARTIESLDGVRSARVHIVQPEPTLFSDEEATPTASILLTLAPGAPLHRTDIEGITQLVAGSVEGLRPSAVTIVSSDGQTLSRGADGETPEELTTRQLEKRREMEQYLARKAQTLLEAVLGPGGAVVAVDADINFEKVDRSTERFEPDTRVLRSEERSTEEGGDAGGSSERSVANYEITKSVEHATGAVGQVKRLSIAVVVDGTYQPGEGEDAEPVFAARTSEELDEYARVVKSAIGFDEARGDRFEISCKSIRGAAPPPAPSGPAVWLPAVTRQIPRAVPLVGFLLLLLLVRRSLARLTQTAAAPAGTAATRYEEVPLPAESGEERGRRLLRERVESIARDRPEETAQLLRYWLLEKR